MLAARPVAPGGASRPGRRVGTYPSGGGGSTTGGRVSGGETAELAKWWVMVSIKDSMRLLVPFAAFLISPCWMSPTPTRMAMASPMNAVGSRSNTANVITPMTMNPITVTCCQDSFIAPPPLVGDLAAGCQPGPSRAFGTFRPRGCLFLRHHHRQLGVLLRAVHLTTTAD